MFSASLQQSPRLRHVGVVGEFVVVFERVVPYCDYEWLFLPPQYLSLLSVTNKLAVVANFYSLGSVLFQKRSSDQCNLAMRQFDSARGLSNKFGQ